MGRLSHPPLATKSTLKAPQETGGTQTSPFPSSRFNFLYKFPGSGEFKGKFEVQCFAALQSVQTRCKTPRPEGKVQPPGSSLLCPSAAPVLGLQLAAAATEKAAGCGPSAQTPALRSWLLASFWPSPDCCNYVESQKVKIISFISPPLLTLPSNHKLDSLKTGIQGS